MDITDRKYAEDALRAGRHNDQLLSTLAHELRNPLAPMRNAVQILRIRGRSADEFRWAVDVIDRQTQQMTRLIDDLLDMARIAYQRFELQTEPVDLAAVLTAAVEATRPFIDAAGLEFRMIGPAAPLGVRGDAARLVQAIANLLHNAAKFTGPGGNVVLQAQRADGHALVTVRDSGAGIAPEMLPHVFDLFVTPDAPFDRGPSALGVGLALAKRLIDMHGGSIAAHSEGLGKGSEFKVRLPIVPDVHPMEASTRAKDTGFTPAPLRILVVDDNHDAAVSLSVLLRMAGHEIRTAYDGLEALHAAADFRPDVTLLDIGLPKMAGDEVARRIRQEAWGENMLLIALTGWGQQADRRRSQDAGFNYHLVKPVDPAALSELLAAARPAPNR